MHINNLTIATMTLALDAAEEKLLRLSLQQLAALNIPVYITDGGSGTSFLDFLQSIPHFRLSQAKLRGVWAQATNSLAEAYQAGSAFILYTEPDKLPFFRESLTTMLNEVQVHGQSGVVLAARSDAGFATFPAFQRMTETTINHCCEEIMGKNFDYTYGPFLLNRNLVPYLKSIQEDIGWGFRPYIFGMAHRLGYSVEAFISDFFCPFEQRNDSPAERIYRMRQLQQNIQGIVLSTTTLLGKE